MGNSTKDLTPKVVRDRLETLVEAYRGLLRADERRLHDAMLEFERACWAERTRRAA